MALQGLARFGKVRRGWERHGVAWLVWQAQARQGMERHGGDWRGEARCSSVWQGMVGMVWISQVMQGWACCSKA